MTEKKKTETIIRIKKIKKIINQQIMNIQAINIANIININMEIKI